MPLTGKRGADWEAEADGCSPEQGAELAAAGGAKQARTEADARSKGGGAAPDAVASTAGTENIVLINSTDGIEQCMRDEKILQLWQSRCAIDIVFESSTNKQTLEAHRLVLAMQSSKLKELISSDLFFQPENGNGRISFVSMSNPVHFEALSVILDWIYKGKCTLPRYGDIGRTALEFSYMWGMDQIKRCLEAHGFVHLTPQSCARCLVNTYKKFIGDDWEKQAKRELQLVLTNFQSLDDRDLLLFPEPVMEKLLASDHLAISSEKMALDRVLYWMKHELAPAESDKGDPASGPSGNGNAGQKGREQSKITNGSSGSSGGAGSGASIGEARVVKRSELRGRSLLKHVRWPEFQREGLSEMFVCPDPAIGHLIQTLLIEALAWANFSLEVRRQRVLSSDTSHHLKHLPTHTVFPREAPLPMTPLACYKSSLAVKEQGQKLLAVGDGGGVAVFGHSTNSAVFHYILEWNGPDDCASLDDGYMGVMCATTLSLEKSGCFVLCGLGAKLGEGKLAQNAAGGVGMSSRSLEQSPYVPGQSVQLTVDASKKELSLWTTDEEGKAVHCLNTKQCQAISTPWIPCVAVFQKGSSFTWRVVE